MNWDGELVVRMAFQLRVRLHETKGEGWVGSLRWIMLEGMGWVRL